MTRFVQMLSTGLVLPLAFASVASAQTAADVPTFAEHIANEMAQSQTPRATQEQQQQQQ